MFSQLVHAPAAAAASAYATTRPAKAFGAVFGMLQSPSPDAPAACPACAQPPCVQCTHALLEDRYAEFGAPPPPYGCAGAPGPPGDKPDAGSKNAKGRGSLVSRGALRCFGVRPTCALMIG